MQFALIEHLLVVWRANVHTAKHTVLNAIFYVALNDCTWRGLPFQCGTTSSTPAGAAGPRLASLTAFGGSSRRSSFYASGCGPLSEAITIRSWPTSDHTTYTALVSMQLNHDRTGFDTCRISWRT